MSHEDVLLELAGRSAEAMVGVLESFAPGQARHGAPAVVAPPDALTEVPLPGLAASVAYVDGVTGGNVFVLSLEGAHRLAAAMLGGEADPDALTGPLGEMEASAAGEAMNQMMAAAAASISAVLGYEVDIAPPETRELRSHDGALAAAFAGSAHATSTPFTVCGVPGRFVQLVPRAFVIRLASALDERGDEVTPTATATASATLTLRDTLLETTAHVSAELGRARLEIDRLAGVPAGTIVDLDRNAEDPIDLYVNGRRFATGWLILTEQDEWAVRVEDVLPSAVPTQSESDRR